MCRYRFAQQTSPAAPRPAAPAATPEPGEFAERWIAAWNARDIAAVLIDYCDDVVFTSPTAARFVPESGGTIRGKDALRAYWEVALEANSDLHFELVEVYGGVDTVVLHYRNQVGGLVSEVLTFRNGLVSVGHATHLSCGACRAGPRIGGR